MRKARPTRTAVTRLLKLGAGSVTFIFAIEVFRSVAGIAGSRFATDFSQTRASSGGAIWSILWGFFIAGTLAFPLFTFLYALLLVMEDRLIFLGVLGLPAESATATETPAAASSDRGTAAGLRFLVRVLVLGIVFYSIVLAWNAIPWTEFYEWTLRHPASDPFFTNTIPALFWGGLIASFGILIVGGLLSALVFLTMEKATGKKFLKD